jgi:hypothetical protein
LKEATPESNGDRVRSIVGAELVHEILDVEVNRGLCDCELIGNLLVATAVSDEPKYFQFPGRQIFIAKMFGEAGGHLRWNMSPPGVDRSDDGEQFIFRHALKDVSRRSCAHCPLDLAIAV